MFYGERQEGRACWGAKFEDCFVRMAVEASSASGCDGGVFDPDLEAPVKSDRGYEVGVDSLGEPLNLFFQLTFILMEDFGLEESTSRISAE